MIHFVKKHKTLFIFLFICLLLLIGINYLFGDLVQYYSYSNQQQAITIAVEHVEAKYDMPMKLTSYYVGFEPIGYFITFQPEDIPGLFFEVRVSKDLDAPHDNLFKQYLIFSYKNEIGPKVQELFGNYLIGIQLTSIPDELIGDIRTIDLDVIKETVYPYVLSVYLLDEHPLEELRNQSDKLFEFVQFLYANNYNGYISIIFDSDPAYSLTIRESNRIDHIDDMVALIEKTMEYYAGK